MSDLIDNIRKLREKRFNESGKEFFTKIKQELIEIIKTKDRKAINDFKRKYYLTKKNENGSNIILKDMEAIAFLKDVIDKWEEGLVKNEEFFDFIKHFNNATVEELENEGWSKKEIKEGKALSSYDERTLKKLFTGNADKDEIFKAVRDKKQEDLIEVEKDFLKEETLEEEYKRYREHIENDHRVKCVDCGLDYQVGYDTYKQCNFKFKCIGCSGGDFPKCFKCNTIIGDKEETTSLGIWDRSYCQKCFASNEKEIVEECSQIRKEKIEEHFYDIVKTLKNIYNPSESKFVRDELLELLAKLKFTHLGHEVE